jgi:hypothetical protein
MNPRLPPGPLRAYRRDGKLVLEIDEHRFCADAFLESQSRILDRDAFLAFACDTVFELLHDDDDAECPPTWWLRFSQAIGEEAANFGAGVRRNDGTDSLPIDQPPNLFPDVLTRELLGPHIKESAFSA